MQVSAQGRRKLDCDQDADEGFIATGHRLCAATRAELDPDELIRFVADPAGEIVPEYSPPPSGAGCMDQGRKGRGNSGHWQQGFCQEPEKAGKS